jgi:hypothetical protein
MARFRVKNARGLSKSRYYVNNCASLAQFGPATAAEVIAGTGLSSTDVAKNSGSIEIPACPLGLGHSLALPHSLLASFFPTLHT